MQFLVVPMRVLSISLVLLLPAWVSAHPVADDNHDRVIHVRLSAGKQPHQLVVTIDYRLEVSTVTAAFSDMRAFVGQVDLTQFAGKPELELYAAYARLHEPIFRDRLRVKLNGRKLELVCVKQSQTLRDEKGEKLGHLRCDFVFQAEAPLKPGEENEFEFREGNYYPPDLEKGSIDLSVMVEASWRIVSLTAPDDQLKKRAVQDQRPKDDGKLREVRVRFVSPASTVIAEAPASKTEPGPEIVRERPDDDHTGLKQLFLDYLLRGKLSFWLVLLMATAFGAMHALTPGHGKTLVAAYLVGQRGTVWHAVFLGLVTTLTHTGAVLILALILGALPLALQKALQDKLQTGVGLALGLLIVCLGFWLLLQRLSGRADHVHLGGGHHHPHGPGHHHHMPSIERVGWGGLVLLGITGGLIPCWDAIILLVATIAYGVFWLAFPLIVAFSAGLAGTLVLVGIAVVKIRSFAESRWGEGRLVRALPILSALVVTAMGFWLCYDSVQGK